MQLLSLVGAISMLTDLHQFESAHPVAAGRIWAVWIDDYPVGLNISIRVQLRLRMQQEPSFPTSVRQDYQTASQERSLYVS